MKIVSICAELAPWCRTGGLGDVTSALPSALKSAYPATEHLTLVPLYAQAKQSLQARGYSLADTGHTVRQTTGGRSWSGRWWRLESSEPHHTYFLECDPLFEGPGLYEMGDQVDDTVTLAHRFSFFCQAAYASAPTLLGSTPDILHLHDWHVGPVAWLAVQSPEAERPKTVVTIHNLAFQGWFPITEIPEFLEALPPSPVPEDTEVIETPTKLSETVDAEEEADEDIEDDAEEDVPYISFLLMGIRHADRVTTVSPQYAREVQTEAFGCGAETLLSERGVTGILNGVDATEWTPATDPLIAVPFSADHPEGRQACRKELLELAGWPEDLDDLVFGAVTRLAHQKGLDWVAEVVPELEALGARLVILGTGDDDLEEAFEALGNTYPNLIHALIRFDIKLSHQIYAGADAFLVPSRFEPCGLTQLYAMQYGSVPIVNPVGGLANTVFDAPKSTRDPAQNGFRMVSADGAGLLDAMGRAVKVWREDPTRWVEIVQAGYAFDSSWTQSGATYVDLFKECLES